MQDETKTDESTDTTTEERQPKSFVDFAGQFVDNDPEVKALKANGELDSGQKAELRYQAMRVERGVQMAQEDFKRLNPDASEVETQDMIQAIYNRDITTVDRLAKQIERKRREKESAESKEKEKRVALNSDDTAKDGSKGGENRFTGQNTRGGIRRLLFGNN